MYDHSDTLSCPQFLIADVTIRTQKEINICNLVTYRQYRFRCEGHANWQKKKIAMTLK